MDYLDRVIKTLESYDNTGVRVLGNGTKLIGHVPHIAPEAWLHQIYAPLQSQYIDRLELDLGFAIPPNFSEFLTRANGLRLFSGHIYFYGLRMNFSRGGDDVWQPYSILTPNLDERPRNSKDKFFFVGGYEPKGSLIYMDVTTLRLFRCSARSAKPLYEWPSFEEMLESEVQRLSARFDREGRLLDPDVSTMPSR